MDEYPSLIGLNEAIHHSFYNHLSEVDLILKHRIWHFAEKLVSPEIEVRQKGFNGLVEISMVHQFPLLVYIMVTRITEPDINLRCDIVRILGELFLESSKKGDEFQAARVLLGDYLRQMRTRQVFSLLQASDYDPSIHQHVLELLKSCSFASNHLSDILLNRKISIGIRKLAAKFMGEIGYLDCIPTLERMEARLVSRSSSQQSLPGTYIQEDEEASLLPLIRSALALLRAP